MHVIRHARQRVGVGRAGLVQRQAHLIRAVAGVNHGAAGCGQRAVLPLDTAQAVLGFDGVVQVHRVGALAGNLRGQVQLDELALAVFEHDIVVALDQIGAAAGQTAAGGHLAAVHLLSPWLAKLIRELHVGAGAAVARTATVVHAKRDQRDRGVAQAQGDGGRVRLAVAGAKQADFVAEVLLVHELGAKAWHGRQVAFGAHVKAVGRALVVVEQVGRGLPV